MKPSQTATTKPIETHEIQPHHQSQIPLPCFYLDRSRGTLEFDEGSAGGAWIDDEAWVDNGAWIGGEMEDYACRRWVSGEMEDWARWVDGMGWRRG